MFNGLALRPGSSAAGRSAAAVGPPRPKSARRQPRRPETPRCSSCAARPSLGHLSHQPGYWCPRRPSRSRLARTRRHRADRGCHPGPGPARHLGESLIRFEPLPAAPRPGPSLLPDHRHRRQHPGGDFVLRYEVKSHPSPAQSSPYVGSPGDHRLALALQAEQEPRTVRFK
jgi:hypothetical protein